MRVPKLRTLLKKNTGKFLILTISLHVIVYYVLLFLRLIIPEQSRQVIFLTNDFKDSFLVGVQRFWEDPTTMYTLNPLITYRNLPATILYYSIFYFLPVPGWHHQLIAFSTCTLVWTMGCCILISKIMDTEQFQRMKVSHTLIGDKYFIISLFLLCPFHAGEYIIGNTDTITCFFVLAGVYYLLKGAPHLAIFYWGIGMMFKITVVILVLFFIIMGGFKQFSRKVFYLVVSLSPSLVMFMIWPPLIIEFLKVNLFYTSTSRILFIPGTFSVALKKYFDIDILPTNFLMMAAFLPVNIIIFYKKKDQMNLMDRLMILFLIIVVLIPNFFGPHVLNYLGIFCLWIATKSPRNWAIPKVIVGVPTFFVNLWYWFPPLSLIYIGGLSTIDAISLLDNGSGITHESQAGTPRQELER